MNSLPPELLSSIVEQAAQCDSSYSSYKLRIRTLSALSLVNRTFRQLAQPLLPQKVWFKCENEVEEFRKIGKMEQVASFKYEHEEREFCHRSFEGFLFMTELRVSQVIDFDVMALNGHQQLKRLCLEKVSLSLRIDFERFALPSVEEVSLEEFQVFVDFAASRARIRFLGPSHFPSLRALGMKSLCNYISNRNGVYTLVDIDYSFIDQLDCVTLNEREYQAWIRFHQVITPSSLPRSFPIPLLFDVDSPTPYSSVAQAVTNAHIQLRFTSEYIPYRLQIDCALSFVRDLLTGSTVLQEVYLDLRFRGTRGYQLNAKLREELEKVEVLAKEKKVEIIWETPEDDWSESTVSKEFWRRCKEKKEKARKGE